MLSFVIGVISPVLFVRRSRGCTDVVLFKMHNPHANITVANIFSTEACSFENLLKKHRKSSQLFGFTVSWILFLHLHVHVVVLHDCLGKCLVFHSCNLLLTVGLLSSHAAK